jgi:hypothetical protein
MMQGVTWKARLNPSSPRYREWRKIFNGDEIQLINNIAYEASLNGQRDTIFLINWFEVMGTEADRMVAYFAEKNNESIEKTEKDLDHDGSVAIRAIDVLITYDSKAFI